MQRKPRKGLHLIVTEPKTEKHRVDEKRGPLLCPMCETTDLIRRQCQTLCLSCGYVESCEDNFVPNEANPSE